MTGKPVKKCLKTKTSIPKMEGEKRKGRKKLKTADVEKGGYKRKKKR